MWKLLLHLVVMVSMLTSAMGRTRFTVKPELTAFCSQLAYIGGSRPVGCRSSGAAAGRVIWQLEQDDPDFAVNAISEPTIRVMNLQAFSEFWRRRMWRSKMYDGVKGIIVITDSKHAEASHEMKLCLGGIKNETCQQSRLNESLALSHEPLPMPVVLLPSSSITFRRVRKNRLIEGIDYISNLWVTLGYTQSQIVNTDCLKRQNHLKSIVISRFLDLTKPVGILCSHIGEMSLAWTARSFNPKVQRSDRSAMIIVTSADAFSIFYNWGSGAAQLHASLSVTLAVIAWLAEVLNSHRSKLIDDRDAVFVFLNSEDFGRAGSRALADKLRNLSGSTFFTEWWGTAAAPLSAKHVQSFIEIGPLGSNATANYLTVTNKTGESVLNEEYMTKQSISMNELSSDTALHHLMSASPGCDAGTLLSDRSLPSQGFTDLRIEASNEKLAAVAVVIASKIVNFLLNDTRFIPSADHLKTRIEYMRSCLSLNANCSELFLGQFDIGDSAARNLRRWRNSGISASISYGAAYASGTLDGNFGDFAPMLVFLETMLLQLTGRKLASHDCQSAKLNRLPTRVYPFRLINGTLLCLSSSIMAISLNHMSMESENAVNPFNSSWVAASHITYPIVQFYVPPQLYVEWLTVAAGFVTFCCSLHIVASQLHAFGFSFNTNAVVTD